MNDAKKEAIAHADAHLNNVNLPTYTALLSLLSDADSWLRDIRAEHSDGSEPGLGDFLDRLTELWEDRL